ncbi:MLP-like protein 43, partial [Mucuna pruriens]
MSLAGKISIEFGVQATATKWFNLFAKQLHHVQNLTDRVHETKLHHGDDWHHKESIKHWTSTIGGKVITYQESIESIDETNKTITYKLFGGDIGRQYKVFKLIFQVIEKDHDVAIIKWSIEYEGIGEKVDPPYDYMEYLYTGSRDIDAHLLKT